MKVGLIGVGRMGGGMARRILGNGFHLKILRRDSQRTDPLAALGAHVSENIAALCEDCDLVVTMLPSDAILEDVATGPSGLTKWLSPGAIHMVSGTHAASAIERLMAAHQLQRQVLICCPVLGRPDRAAEGKLGLLPAGPSTAIEHIMPVLRVLGETIFRPGENPLSAVAVKIANNLVLGCAIEAMGEGMSLVRKYDVDPVLFHEVLTKGLFNCIAYQSYGDVIAKEDWGRVGAAASIGLKDAKLAIAAAEQVGVTLPSGVVWHDHLVKACARGEGALDWAVMAREQFRSSGLE